MKCLITDLLHRLILGYSYCHKLLSREVETIHIIVKNLPLLLIIRRFSSESLFSLSPTITAQIMRSIKLFSFPKIPQPRRAFHDICLGGLA